MRNPSWAGKDAYFGVEASIQKGGSIKHLGDMIKSQDQPISPEAREAAKDICYIVGADPRYRENVERFENLIQLAISKQAAAHELEIKKYEEMVKALLGRVNHTNECRANHAMSYHIHNPMASVCDCGLRQLVINAQQAIQNLTKGK